MPELRKERRAAGPITREGRVTLDPPSGAIRSWFDPAAGPLTREPFVPREVARQVLRRSATLFGWEPTLPDLRDAATLRGANAFSVRFTQEFKGIAVDAGEVVVNMHADSRVHSVYDQYHYDIPQDLDPARIHVDAIRARQLVARLSNAYAQREIEEPELIIYQHRPVERIPPKRGRRPRRHREKFLAAVRRELARGAARGYRPREGQYFLAWDLTLATRQPRHRWRLLVDALEGRLIDVSDLVAYASGRGKVFDPNPIVSGGDVALSSNTKAGTLNAQRVPVTLERLDPPDSAGKLHLDGAWVHMEDYDDPAYPEPRSASGRFIFGWKNRRFLDVMVYFHIDRFQEYLQRELGLRNVADFSVRVDPQGQSGADGSSGAATGISYGEGGVPDASDAMVILHEYGHAIQDHVNPGSAVGSYGDGVSEGFCDFLAAVFYDDKHANPAATRGIVFAWDANPTDHSWAGRRCDWPWRFDGAEWAAGNGYTRGELWCATMFELYRKLGGDSAQPAVRRAARDLLIRLHLMANFHVPSRRATPTQMAQQIEAADGNLAGWRYPNGLHRKVIYETLSRRRLAGYPDRAVDVYIDDGRGGGYGSATGQDLFDENLWKENHGDSPDVWVRTAPYATAADQTAGGPGDHLEPRVNAPASLYVRVKNRGSAASGPVTVRAFRAVPGGGLVWPGGWTPMTPASQPVADVPSGPGSAVIVGPFTWTPTTVGRESVLVVLECANDRAITQDLLPADRVPHLELVPFDNNIALRELAPTP